MDFECLRASRRSGKFRATAHGISVVVLYFLMIRPQMKRNKEHRQMIEALKKGDEVITAGGLVAKVTKVGEAYVSIEVAKHGEQSVEMHVQKQAVTALLPVGTIKSI
ncbi:MAG: preprotein translocase subunit YajC [Pseudomonadota bacterium]